MTATTTSAAETVEIVRPDNKFVRDVIRLGGTSAKKCFQCGTCTATCNVSYAKDGDGSYPRLLMLWTQWGLKDKVLSDPSIWACHQCNDCSANCPRGAKPGDVLAALRALAIERYSVPRFMARVYREAKYIPLIFGIPAVLIVVLLYLFNGMTYPTGDVVYRHFIPVIYIELAGVVVGALAVLGGALGLLGFWKNLKIPDADDLARWRTAPGPGAMASATPAKGLEATFASTMGDIVKHSDFQACEADKLRTYGHLLVFYGTPFLLFAAGLAAIYSTLEVEMVGLGNIAVKTAGNLGGGMLLVGVALLAYNRLHSGKGRWGIGTYFDWFFLALIFVNVLTGIAVQLARFANDPSIAYPLYITHLAIVFGSFWYAPYGKLAHAFYRTAALTALRHGGKTSPHKLYILLPAAVGVAVGAVTAIVGVLVAAVWIAQALPAAMANLGGPAGLSLNLYLPVANVSIPIWLLIGVGFGVGLLSGMTGVGGGFIMTPLLMTIGVPSAPAVGTDSTQIAGTASSGALAHWRLGNVDVKLGLSILTGSVIGGTIGVQIVAMLRAIGNFDFWVRIIYVVVLGTVGSLMLRESIQTWIRSVKGRFINALVSEGFEELRPRLAATPAQAQVSGFSRFTANWPLQTEFKKARVRCSILFPFGLGLTVGILAAIMGVGGGFIMVPSMIYILGVPTHVAVGTDLFQMVFTAANVGFQQALVNHNVDIVLAVLLLVGAAVGAQIGARMGHRLEGYQLRTFLGAIVIIVMIKMLFDIIVAPESLISVSAGGGGGH